jgi:hypothetical protein
MGLVRTTPINEMGVSAQCVVSDTTGGYFFDPNSMPHAYSYTAGGSIQTDTITDGTLSFKKTYTYNGSNQLSAETGWVKQ